MKMLKTLFILILGSSILSCSKAVETEMKLNILGKNAYLIEAPGQSCTNVRDVDQDPVNFSVNYDLSKLYFSYNTATISWENTENMAFIAAMKIEFTGNNVSYSCSIAGDELLSIFYDPATNTGWDGTLAKAPAKETPTTVTSFCPIRCGGVTVTKDSKAFATNGTITLVGFERTPAGEEFPLKASETVKLYYQ